MPTIDDMKARVGQRVATSDWLTVDQAMIDRFADATGDHQFIHVDAERARAETPFGGTIAHGFLTLSLLSRFADGHLPRLDGRAMGINVGFDKVRFITPVPSGSRIRAVFTLQGLSERRQGQMQLEYDVTVEIEGGARPALAARWLTISVLGPNNGAAR